MLNVPAQEAGKIVEDVDREREGKAVKMRPLLLRGKNGDDGDGGFEHIESSSIAFAINAS